MKKILTKKYRSTKFMERFFNLANTYWHKRETNEWNTASMISIHITRDK